MKFPSAENRGDVIYACGADGISCCALEAAVCRTHKLSCPPSRTTYATYRPSAETAEAVTLPFDVRREIRPFVTSGKRSRSLFAFRRFQPKKAPTAIANTTKTITSVRSATKDGAAL